MAGAGRRPEAARSCCRAEETRAARRWSALARCGAFLEWALFEATAQRRDGRGLRLCLDVQMPFVRRRGSSLQIKSQALNKV